MRRFKGLVAILIVLVVGGCQGTTVPERRELLGSWVSAGFPDATIRMTLTETVRAVDGAGSWAGPADGRAFRVSGTIAGEEISLYLEFEEGADLNFQGYFRDAGALQGFLTGGIYLRQAITFDREVLR